MKEQAIIPGAQTHQYEDWHIVHSPTLSLSWLLNLLAIKLPVKKDDDDRVIKLEDSSLILKLESDLGDLAAKHYRKLTIKRVLRNTIEHSRAHRCWYYAHLLLKQGLETPKPLAYIEQRKMGLTLKGWYICQFEDHNSCQDYFLRHESITPAMVITAATIVDTFVRLRKCQLSHGDFKANNLLISESETLLIDLDSMKSHSNEEKAERMWRRDIKRFMINWHERFDIYNLFKQTFLKRGIEI